MSWADAVNDWLNFGDLGRYPLQADVWGDAATWTGALFTGGAALIAAIVYARGRRQDKWAQASLIDFELGAGEYQVHNRSEQPAIGVWIKLKPRSLWSATRSGNYGGAVVFGGPTLAAFPSHEFYLAARASHSRKRSRQAKQRKLIAEKIEPGGSAPVNLEWVTAAGFKSFVEFRDVKGNSWEYDIEEERLRSIQRRPSPLKERNDRLWAVQWIIKNEAIYFWRNYLYHPQGRPPRE